MRAKQVYGRILFPDSSVKWWKTAGDAINPAGAHAGRREEYTILAASGVKKEILTKNPEATSVAIEKNGWLHRGDLAVLEEEGYCNIKRAKDRIIRGGQNVYER